jgi:hypothetical protein
VPYIFSHVRVTALYVTHSLRHIVSQKRHYGETAGEKHEKCTFAGTETRKTGQFQSQMGKTLYFCPLKSIYMERRRTCHYNYSPCDARRQGLMP